jgi:hypothetical protein
MKAQRSPKARRNEKKNGEAHFVGLKVLFVCKRLKADNW